MCFSAVKLFKTPAASRLQPTCFKHWQGTKHESCMFAIAGRQQQAGDSLLLAEALSDFSSQQKEPSRLSSAKAFVHDEACSLNNATLQKNCKEFKPLPSCSFQARKAFKTTGLFSFAFLTKQAVASCFTSWLSSWQAGLSQSAQWACWPCWLQNGFCAGLCLIGRAGHGQQLMLLDHPRIAETLDLQSAMLLLLPNQVGLLSARDPPKRHTAATASSFSCRHLESLERPHSQLASLLGSQTWLAHLSSFFLSSLESEPLCF